MRQIIAAMLLLLAACASPSDHDGHVHDINYHADPNHCAKHPQSLLCEE